MAIKDEGGAFAGCGFAPGQDIANHARMLNIRLTDLAAAMAKPDGKADVALMRGLEQTLGAVNATLEEVRREGEATRKLVGALLERMAKKK